MERQALGGGSTLEQLLILTLSISMCDSLLPPLVLKLMTFRLVKTQIRESMQQTTYHPRLGLVLTGQQRVRTQVLAVLAQGGLL